MWTKHVILSCKYGSHAHTHARTHTHRPVTSHIPFWCSSYKPPEGLAVGGPLTSSGEISQHSLEQARASSRSGSPEMLGDKKDKPSTPPPPQEAFEEFKKTRGVNINQVLMESKGELTVHCWYILGEIENAYHTVW